MNEAFAIMDRFPKAFCVNEVVARNFGFDEDSRLAWQSMIAKRLKPCYPMEKMKEADLV